jgi:hypothetical protein
MLYLKLVVLVYIWLYENYAIVNYLKDHAEYKR